MYFYSLSTATVLGTPLPTCLISSPNRTAGSLTQGGNINEGEDSL